MYPITIVDNFLDDPDKIVDFAMKQEFYPNTGSWPGSRTKQISELDLSLYDYLCVKILSLFHSEVDSWDFEMSFQLITPYSKRQHDPKNRGWIHTDRGGPSFAGIIYLNKNPEIDTGTSIYKQKNGWSTQFFSSLTVKERFYRGEEISDEEYNDGWNLLNSQYEETIAVENIYNRMLLFNCNTYHGAKTFGKNQDRLTLPFFCRSANTRSQPPFYK